ncbi:hypothetical protein MMC12_003706 [Toensbergia leucococca]|nr:hypothetical protein [Toensbergia leucococca]
MSNRPLEPTFYGHVASTKDALVLFEACLSGILPHVPRRPHDRERAHLIKSGHVFIYEENASGIKRWTDGVPWSPSRIKSNFLLYRELAKPFAPGEKKKAIKRNQRPTKRGEPYPRPFAEKESNNSSAALSPTSPSTPSTKAQGSFDNDAEERDLTGSLVDSYDFKEDGLFKKTMSVVVQNVRHHLVSYYAVADVKSGKLGPPAKSLLHPRLAKVQPRADLTMSQNFRTPIEDVEDGMQDSIDGSQSHYYEMSNGYDTRPVLSHSSMITNHMYFGGAHSSAAPNLPAMALTTSIPSISSSFHVPVQQMTSRPEDFNLYSGAQFPRSYDNFNGTGNASQPYHQLQARPIQTPRAMSTINIPSTVYAPNSAPPARPHGNMGHYAPGNPSWEPSPTGGHGHPASHYGQHGAWPSQNPLDTRHIYPPRS